MVDVALILQSLAGKWISHNDISPRSIHLSNRDLCPHPDLTVGVLSTFFHHQSESDFDLDQFCFPPAIPFYFFMENSIPKSQHYPTAPTRFYSFPNDTRSFCASYWAELGEFSNTASLAQVPDDELIQPLWGQEGNLPRDIPCYFSFLFLPRAPRGEYLPGNIPCHDFCREQRTVADLPLVCY